MDIILFALWFFLPGGVANLVPILAAHSPLLSRLNAPIDRGAVYRGKRVLGGNKTWRGLVVGIIAASLVVYVQQLLFQHNDITFLSRHTGDYLYNSPLLLGFLFGFGALAGDAIESFFKRQANVPAGNAWFPFDQTDYILGGCLAVSTVARLSLGQYTVILLTWFLMHLLFSYIGYLLRLKPRPL